MGGLLPRFLIYCCISSLQTRYVLQHCRNAGLCLDQGFLLTFNNCYLWFSKGRQFSGNRSLVRHFFDVFPPTQLPGPRSAFAVAGKPLRLVHGIEEASYTASCSRALDRCSAIVSCRLSLSFSFAEEALVCNCILFCHHCKCYI